MFTFHDRYVDGGTYIVSVLKKIILMSLDRPIPLSLYDDHFEFSPK